VNHETYKRLIYFVKKYGSYIELGNMGIN